MRAREFVIVPVEVIKKMAAKASSISSTPTIPDEIESLENCPDEEDILVGPLQQELELRKANQGKVSTVINQIVKDEDM